MDRRRAGRNRTITLDAQQAAACLERCLPGAALPGTLPHNVVVHGDAFEALGHIAPQSVDLLVVDPPYNLRKQYGGTLFSPMDEAAYRDLTERWLAAALPALKPTASVYVCCDWAGSLIIGPVLAAHLTLRNRITWQREKGRGAAKNWKNTLEDIWFATVSNDYTFHQKAVMLRRRVLAPYREDGRPKDWEETEAGRFRNTAPANFWDDITVPYWSMPENTDHPTQKPEKLIARLVLAGSNAGDVVLDPFAGVGTTAVVAKKLGRRYIAIEREAAYCALAQHRLALADGDAAIQGYAGGVFWERNTAAAQRAARQAGKNSHKNAGK